MPDKIEDLRYKEAMRNSLMIYIEKIEDLRYDPYHGALLDILHHMEYDLYEEKLRLDVGHILSIYNLYYHSNNNTRALRMGKGYHNLSIVIWYMGCMLTG